MNFPVFPRVTGIFPPETGSIPTATATTQSDTNRRFPVSDEYLAFLRAFPQVQIPGVRSLLPAEGAIAEILAPGLWALQTRSWRRPGCSKEDRQDQIDKPSIAYWRDHSEGRRADG